MEEPLIFFFEEVYVRISFRIINQEVYFFVTMMNVMEKVVFLNLHDNLRFKNQLIKSLSHEIRTPINFILGSNENLKVLILKYLDEQTQKYFLEDIDHIVSAIKQLSLMIQNIVDHSMLQSSDFRLIAKKFSTRQLITELMQIYEMKAKLKSITIDISRVTDVEWLSDPDRIKGLLSIFIENAIKFTVQGSIKITC